jgi:thioredoxin-like negative regulator of GroEL
VTAVVRSYRSILFVGGRFTDIDHRFSFYPSGIRNFLTLFLSIEVSKAMQEVADARDTGDLERQQYAQKMVDYFTEQLNESNPILTEISEAMTEEGHCQEKLSALMDQNQPKQAATWKAKMEAAAERKRHGNARLMECSARYNDLMKSIRVSRSGV